MSGDARDLVRAKLMAIDRIRHDSSLSSSIRMAGAEIVSLINTDLGYAYASETYLAEKLGLAQRTIKMAVKALREAGHLDVVKVGRSNRYLLGNGKGQILPLSSEQQVQTLPLSDADRGKKRREKGQKTTGNRGKKGPPISLEISLRPLGASGDGGAPHGAAAPTLFDLGPAAGPLRQRFGAATFESWLAKIAVVSEEGDTVTLAAPTRFVASYVETHFAAAIVDCWRIARPETARLRIVVGAAEPRAAVGTRAVPDSARWLLETGRCLVRDRMRVSSSTAELQIIDWLRACGNDAGALAAILSSADVQGLEGERFRDIVGQRLRELADADQLTLPNTRPLMALK